MTRAGSRSIRSRAVQCRDSLHGALAQVWSRRASNPPTDCSVCRLPTPPVGHLCRGAVPSRRAGKSIKYPACFSPTWFRKEANSWSAVEPMVELSRPASSSGAPVHFDNSGRVFPSPSTTPLKARWKWSARMTACRNVRHDAACRPGGHTPVAGQNAFLRPRGRHFWPAEISMGDGAAWSNPARPVPRIASAACVRTHSRVFQPALSNSAARR